VNAAEMELEGQAVITNFFSQLPPLSHLKFCPKKSVFSSIFSPNLVAYFRFIFTKKVIEIYRFLNGIS